MARTPISQDKRLMLAAAVIGVVCAGAWLGKHLNGEELTFITLTLAGYMGQSQWGQTKRATAEAANARSAP